MDGLHADDRVDDKIRPQVIFQYFLSADKLFWLKHKFGFRARDKWLKPGGLMFPCRAEVFIAAMAEEENSDWEEMSDRYKVDLSCCAAVESAGRIGKMVVREVDDAELISRPTQIFQLDLALVKIEEVESLCKGQFQLGSIGDCKVAGFCVFFDVEFPGGVKLSTSPQADLTHWCQTVLAVEPFAVHQDELISGELRFEQNSSNKRLLTVHLRVENSQKNYKFDHYSEEV